MSEDAFGYEKTPKKILIVDDINDTGATFNWIKQDWSASCLPDDPRWEKVWYSNVRFATLTNNLASDATVPVSYTCHEINKFEEDVWLVYPWENVGEYT
jgi:hypoxanthine phosphoribosyltransferase